MAPLGETHLHFDVVDSTNALAKQKALEGAPSGTIITADEQTAGRGRQGRSWVAPPRSGLLMSLIVRPAQARHRFAPLVAALAVAETCEALGASEAQIKWPNDVWIEGRKVSGILVEGRPDADPAKSWVVIGIGLNTCVDLAHMPEDLQRTAATLGLPAEIDALSPLLTRLEYWLSVDPADVVIAWSQRDALKGRSITWEGGEGIADGIDAVGNLRVITADGREMMLGAGEVHLSLS